MCSGKSFRLFHDKFRYDEKCEAIQCERCGLVMQRNIEFKENYESFYKSEYAQKYYEGKKRDFENRFNLFSELQGKRLELSAPYLNKEARCLEVGSSVGYFLYRIKDNVKSILGIELNEMEARWASEEKGIPTITKSLLEPDTVEESSMDVIFLFQILEHTPNPVIFLQQVRKKLVRDGVVIIEVPNLMNPLISLYEIDAFKNFWFQRPHLYYFASETLKGVIEKAGFEVEKLIHFQEISFVNHINWMLTGKPMEHRRASIAPVVPVDNVSTNNRLVFEEINELFKEFNAQYMELIEKHGFGDMVFAVGRNKSD